MKRWIEGYVPREGTNATVTPEGAASDSRDNVVEDVAKDGDGPRAEGEDGAAAAVLLSDRVEGELEECSEETEEAAPESEQRKDGQVETTLHEKYNRKNRKE